MSKRAKKFRTRECAEFFTFPLFTLHFSLISPARLFQRKDKREERKEKVDFLPLVEKQ